MKKFITVLLCVCLILSVSSCGESDQKKLIEEGKLYVGIEPEYPPMETKVDGQYTGIDVEFILALGEKMNLEVEFVDLAWSAIFIALDGEQIDIVCSSVSITQKRIDEKKMMFSDPYLSNGIYIVTDKENTSIKTIEDLKGLVVAVQEDTTADYACKKYLEANPNAFKLQSLETVQSALMALESGQVDALVADSPVAMHFVMNNPEKFAVTSSQLTNEPIAIAIRYGNDDLQKEINEAIKALQEDGTLSKISLKYLGEDCTQNISTELVLY